MRIALQVVRQRKPHPEECTVVKVGNLPIQREQRTPSCMVSQSNRMREEIEMEMEMQRE